MKGLLPGNFKVEDKDGIFHFIEKVKANRGEKFKRPMIAYKSDYEMAIYNYNKHHHREPKPKSPKKIYKDKYEEEYDKMTKNLTKYDQFLQRAKDHQTDSYLNMATGQVFFAKPPPPKPPKPKVEDKKKKKRNPYIAYNGLLRFPISMSPEDTQQRKKMFDMIDGNGNGLLSLAEVDGGVRDKLSLDDLFAAKPALIRAFNAAKASEKGSKTHDDDYVDLREFRILLVYLQQYHEYYKMFQMIDKSGDRRVSLEEFKMARPIMKKFGVVINNMEEEFKKIDRDGGGFILFEEFADYCIKNSLTIKDADHEEKQKKFDKKQDGKVDETEIKNDEAKRQNQFWDNQQQFYEKKKDQIQQSKDEDNQQELQQSEEKESFNYIDYDKVDDVLDYL